MGKNKIRRFEENKTLVNVFQPTREEALSGYEMKGKWRTNFFKNDNPIVLELGCGKGEYSVGMAKAFPDKNFIGVDIKGARFWFGAKEAVEKNLTNVAFLRTQIELIDLFFEKDEVDEIWITFPDPQIKFKRAKHRMTHPDFLERYKNIVKKDGYIHLKTDSEFLHGYTLGILQALGYDVEVSHHDIYGAPEFETDAVHLREIKTYYEGLFSAKGKTITYLRFKI
ncbi:tRNA (guanosine(46)-N7)-methyltransferase TrmB [Elizabethkingia anophelis]|uniref:tRNA (guanosine(46)-N7)-methyltransferase TrmB n=1 Tax=Elizabethkingia TaxID=308865 RepID=UPI00038A10B1|nr:MULTISPECIES: tRNA (guanosine(46)-N7)-methyltransferase TrmB [Elizabethkingia]AVF47181.1 tRNA (guanosine(46)-N7)-methyltransferase TrmB [Elizabethkingia anophelis]AVF51173.1 tRNA (guanosine(46)-N7)-methyltransferase TrmB [Elizabethkingia anophelis]EQB91443.1 tRNA (guanine-N(7)-)-methyltransferase [Elizabethkingia anophelis 502]MBG0504688.1 tRNA (guanosine(46)-N7)-methyltransferase TrmB [Elizabethkingia anophelis]MCT3670722.1 tRNA (guanosine(46)-N7)-methyltransferase TrmB [Elizabethkingia an